MSWKESCPMQERIRFMADVEREEWSLSALCRAYGVSRKTGYKWIELFKQGGFGALSDRSRAAHRHPNATPAETLEAILSFRARHPTWGPRKLVARLAALEPARRWPAPSTAGEILRRHGLSSPRRRSRRCEPSRAPFQDCRAPNDVWGLDFKGWFRTGDGRRCDPLTLTDAHSRYLLRCQGLTTTRSPWVRPIVEAAFREYGLPRAIRTDNGAPFASLAPAGLSRLSAWWIKLGITPERIEPGHPEQNGRHERMHATLKQETARPPRANLRAQQRAFDRFRREFNEERPHEALGQHPPASIYASSARAYPEKLKALEYPAAMETHKVQEHGQIRWRGGRLFVSATLAGENIGLEQVEDRTWKVYFAHLELGTFEPSPERENWSLSRNRRGEREAPGRGGLRPPDPPRRVD